ELEQRRGQSVLGGRLRNLLRPGITRVVLPDVDVRVNNSQRRRFFAHDGNGGVGSQQGGTASGAEKIADGGGPRHNSGRVGLTTCNACPTPVQAGIEWDLTFPGDPTMNAPTLSRRDFLETSGSLTAGLALASLTAPAGGQAAGANERL